MVSVDRAGQQLISCSDHGPELPEAVHCVDPDMTSRYAQQQLQQQLHCQHPTTDVRAVICRMTAYRIAGGKCSTFIVAQSYLQ